MAAGSTYVITGPGLSADDLRALRYWLLEVCDLAGPVDLRQADPRPGELGSVTDALVVAVGSGGAVTALTGAVVSWLRHRTADVAVRLVRPDGSELEFAGKRVRGVDATQVSAMIEQLAAQLADAPPATESRPATETPTTPVLWGSSPGRFL
jgi:hypothetical protein